MSRKITKSIKEIADNGLLTDERYDEWGMEYPSYPCPTHGYGGIHPIVSVWSATLDNKYFVHCRACDTDLTVLGSDELTTYIPDMLPEDAATIARLEAEKDAKKMSHTITKTTKEVIENHLFDNPNYKGWMLMLEIRCDGTGAAHRIGVITALVHDGMPTLYQATCTRCGESLIITEETELTVEVADTSPEDAATIARLQAELKALRDQQPAPDPEMDQFAELVGKPDPSDHLHALLDAAVDNFTPDKWGGLIHFLEADELGVYYVAGVVGDDVPDRDAALVLVLDEIRNKLDALFEVLTLGVVGAIDPDVLEEYPDRGSLVGFEVKKILTAAELERGQMFRLEPFMPENERRHAKFERYMSQLIAADWKLQPNPVQLDSGMILYCLIRY